MSELSQRLETHMYSHGPIFRDRVRGTPVAKADAVLLPLIDRPSAPIWRLGVVILVAPNVMV